ICNKLYPAEIISTNGIMFDPELRIGQDVLFNLSVFTKVRTVSIIPNLFYHYVEKYGSLMASSPKKRLMSFNRIISEFKNFCFQQGDTESWEVFSRHIGLAYQSYFFNIVLDSQYSSKFTFTQYYRYLLEML